MAGNGLKGDVTCNLMRNIDSGKLAAIYSIVRDQSRRFVFYLKKLIQVKNVNRSLMGYDQNYQEFALNFAGERPLLVKSGYMFRSFISRSGGKKQVLPNGNIHITVSAPRLQSQTEKNPETGKDLKDPVTGKKIYKKNPKTNRAIPRGGHYWAIQEGRKNRTVVREKKETRSTYGLFKFVKVKTTKTSFKGNVETPKREWMGFALQDLEQFVQLYIEPYYQAAQAVMISGMFEDFTPVEAAMLMNNFLNDYMLNGTAWKDLNVAFVNRLGIAHTNSFARDHGLGYKNLRIKTKNLINAKIREFKKRHKERKA